VLENLPAKENNKCLGRKIKKRFSVKIQKKLLVQNRKGQAVTRNRKEEKKRRFPY